jgi:exodeoxyribonuclease-3
MDMLRSTQPDIAIVPECSKSIVQTLQGFSGFWSGGDYVAKGLGVLWKDGWKLTRIGQPDAAESFDRWIVAFDVRGPENFTLIAIWSHNDKHGIRGYVGQIHRAFNAHPEWFTRGPVMVAGDFNSSGHWDKQCAPENHAKLVKFLGDRGIVSAYHFMSGEEQNGKEKQPTFHQTKNTEKPFHLDYIFLPRDWSSRIHGLEVGRHSKWLKYSDHCPVTVELRSERLRRTPSDAHTSCKIRP